MSKQHSYRILHQGKVIHELTEAAGMLPNGNMPSIPEWHTRTITTGMLPKAVAEVRHAVERDVLPTEAIRETVNNFSEAHKEAEKQVLASDALPDVRRVYEAVTQMRQGWNAEDFGPAINSVYGAKAVRFLSAAYQKYCGGILEDAHGAQVDARASYDILNGQLDQHKELDESVAFLHKFCNPKKPGAIGDSGSLLETDKGPIINFGNNHLGRLVSDVAVDDPGYLNWMLDKDLDPEVKLLISKALGR